MSKPTILLVEDESHIAQTIQLNLEFEGYEVQHAGDGKIALHKFKSFDFDLVILDIMLPEIDGLTLCDLFRDQNKTIPILILSARNSSSDKVEGLKLGADDYLTKPFNLEELLLRVKNLLRRTGSYSENPKELSEFSFDAFHVNFKTYEVIGLNEQKFLLNKKELLLLKLLIERKNQVVSRDEILEKIWEVEALPTSRTIDNYILAFRKYFESNPKEPKYFHSIRGVGYKFTR
ncbi:MAG: response regulator transcription factor [Bacteroidetes bacterium]|nr:response regulator transcription factor [Bacteroidota bacterium]